jgi:hypothetical protein
MWLFKEQHLSSPHWRNQRSYLMSEQVFLLAMLHCVAFLEQMLITIVEI